MRRISVIVKPFKAEEILEALLEEGIEDVLVTEVRGFGRQKGYTDLYRSDDSDMTFVPKIQVECYVPYERLEAVEKKIRDVACTGRIGDGKMFVIGAEEIEVG
jgi:nitrogen regulatory protein PII